MNPKHLLLLWIAASSTGPASLLPIPTAMAAPVTAFSGMCDASAIVMIDAHRFVAANDEDNVLRMYHRNRPGPPERSWDLGSHLHDADPAEESDLEGAARLGTRLYWITSHGANKKGKARPSRRRLFAVELDGPGEAPRLSPVGQPCTGLLEAMLKDPRLAALHLDRASRRPPKEPGALNIEGLSATPEGTLLIGLRNPVPAGRAWLIPLLNPDDTLRGIEPRFGAPIQLDLGGLGIRSIELFEDSYLIVAGPVDGEGASHLYSWAGPGASPRLLADYGMQDLNPEAIAVYREDSVTRLWVVSDDGTREIAREECKNLDDPTRQQFRAQALTWIPPTDTAALRFVPGGRSTTFPTQEDRP